MKDLNQISNYYEQIKMINTLLQKKEGRQYIKENFSKIKKVILNDSDQEQLNNFLNFIRSLGEFPEFEEEYEDYSYWVELYEQIKIPEYDLKTSVGLFNMSDKELRRVLMAMDAKVVKNKLFNDILISNNPNTRQEKRIILQEISQGKEYEFKSCGTSSLIIQSGDQVIKMGLMRRKYEVPYHPRIMMPYFRKKYEDGSCLEIFNYGDVESAKITDEKVLEIYKELESAGILWGDASKRNLAVLLKDNNLPDFVHSKDFNLFGFLEDKRFPTDNHIPLKAGDIVVCDLDMLYAKGDVAYHLGYVDDIIEEYLANKRRRAKAEEHNKDKNQVR